MPAPTKTSTKKTDAPVAAPVVEAAAPAPVADTKAKRAKKEVAPAPVVEAAAATPAPAVETPVVAEAAENSATAEMMLMLYAKLNSATAIISEIKSHLRNVEKTYNRELKTAQKASSKRKRKTGSRAPSGFVKPTKISDELASFLEKPKGSEMARTVVTKEINEYIRRHNLQDKDNGRKINPDAKLASLLKLKKTDELTYFNLQKYMSIHFAKAVPAATAATASATA